MSLAAMAGDEFHLENRRGSSFLSLLVSSSLTRSVLARSISNSSARSASMEVKRGSLVSSSFVASARAGQISYHPPFYAHEGLHPSRSPCSLGLAVLGVPDSEVAAIAMIVTVDRSREKCRGSSDFDISWPKPDAGRGRALSVFGLSESKSGQA